MIILSIHWAPLRLILWLWLLTALPTGAQGNNVSDFQAFQENILDQTVLRIEPGFTVVETNSIQVTVTNITCSGLTLDHVGVDSQESTDGQAVKLILEVEGVDVICTAEYQYNTTLAPESLDLELQGSGKLRVESTNNSLALETIFYEKEIVQENSSSTANSSSNATEEAEEEKETILKSHSSCLANINLDLIGVTVPGDQDLVAIAGSRLRKTLEQMIQDVLCQLVEDAVDDTLVPMIQTVDETLTDVVDEDPGDPAAAEEALLEEVASENQDNNGSNSVELVDFQQLQNSSTLLGTIQQLMGRAVDYLMSPLTKSNANNTIDHNESDIKANELMGLHILDDGVLVIDLGNSNTSTGNTTNGFIVFDMQDDDNDSLSTTIVAHELRLYGLDSLTHVDILVAPNLSHTLQAEVSWQSLRVQVDMTATLRTAPSTMEDPLIIFVEHNETYISSLDYDNYNVSTAGAEPITVNTPLGEAADEIIVLDNFTTYDFALVDTTDASELLVVKEGEVTNRFTVEFGFEDIDVVVSILLGLDQTQLQQLVLGNMLVFDDILPCLLSTIHTILISSLDVRFGNSISPTVTGFESPGVNELLSDTADAFVLLFEEQFLELSNAVFHTLVRDQINNGLDALVNEPNRTCSMIPIPEPTPESMGSVDFRELFLLPDESIEIGGPGVMLYGDVVPIYLMSELKEQLSGGDAVNTAIVEPATEVQSGEEGTLLFPDPVVNVTNDVKLGHLEATVRVQVSNITLRNLDTIGEPFQLLSPTNRTILDNIANIGTMKPLEISAMALFAASDGQEMNLHNQIELSLSLSDLTAYLQLLLTISEKMFLTFPLEDISNAYCWVATIIPKSASSQQNSSTPTGIGITDYALFYRAAIGDVSCVSCTSPLFAEMLLYLYNLDNVAQLLTVGIDLGKQFFGNETNQSFLDDGVSKAASLCPHSEFYNPNATPNINSFIESAVDSPLDLADWDVRDDNSSFFNKAAGYFTIYMLFLLLCLKLVVRNRNERWKQSLSEEASLLLYCQFDAEREQQQAIDRFSKSLFRCPSLSKRVRYSVPVVILINIGLVMCLHLALLHLISFRIVLAGEEFTIHGILEVRFLGGTFDPLGFNSGGLEKAILTWIFAFILPYLKVTSLLFLWFVPPQIMSTSTRRVAIQWIDALTKLSLVDSIRVVLILGALLVFIGGPETSDNGEYFSLKVLLEPQFAFYCGVMGMQVSRMSSQWVIDHHDESIEAARRAYGEGVLEEHFAAAAGNMGTHRYDRLEQKAIDFVNRGKSASHAWRANLKTRLERRNPENPDKAFGLETANTTSEDQEKAAKSYKESARLETLDAIQPVLIKPQKTTQEGDGITSEYLNRLDVEEHTDENNINVDSLIRSLQQVARFEDSLLASKGSAAPGRNDDETLYDHSNETVGRRHVVICGHKLLLGELGARLGFIFIILLIILGLALTPVLSIDVSRLVQVVLMEAESYHEASTDIGVFALIGEVLLQTRFWLDSKFDYVALGLILSALVLAASVNFLLGVYRRISRCYYEGWRAAVPCFATPEDEDKNEDEPDRYELPEYLRLHAWNHVEIYVVAVCIGCWQLGAVFIFLIHQYCSLMGLIYAILVVVGLADDSVANCYESQMQQGSNLAVFFGSFGLMLITFAMNVKQQRQANVHQACSLLKQLQKDEESIERLCELWNKDSERKKKGGGVKKNLRVLAASTAKRMLPIPFHVANEAETARDATA